MATRTITALFESAAEAERAADQLAAVGISRTAVSIVRQDATAAAPDTAERREEGGFLNALADFFMPDEDRYTYAEGLRRGGYLVSVHASDADYERVIDILDDEGTIDIDERSSAWRSEGWTGTSDVLSGSTANLTTGSSGASSTATSTGAALGATSTNTASERTTSDREEVIPVAEEEIRVGKREVSRGRVRVHSYVVETPVTEQVNLREERVHVERRAVDRPVTAADEALFR